MSETQTLIDVLKERDLLEPEMVGLPPGGNYTAQENFWIDEIRFSRRSGPWEEVTDAIVSMWAATARLAMNGAPLDPISRDEEGLLFGRILLQPGHTVCVSVPGMHPDAALVEVHGWKAKPGAYQTLMEEMILSAADTARESMSDALKAGPPPWEEVIEGLHLRAGDNLQVSFRQDGIIEQRAFAVRTDDDIPKIKRFLLFMKQPDTDLGSLLVNGDSVIRYSSLRPQKHRFEISTDSGEYEILERAARAIKGVPGMTCELGVRYGGGTKVILDALVDNQDFGRHHICIDPYGDLDFPWHGELIHPGYTNRMRNDAMANLYEYVRGLPVNLHFFVLTDEDFFIRFERGLPIYDKQRTVLDRYALVHIDGPHDTDSVQREVSFFKTRMALGGRIVFDDWKEYDHEPVDRRLKKDGFSVVEAGDVKICYEATPCEECGGGGEIAQRSDGSDDPEDFVGGRKTCDWCGGRGTGKLAWR